MRSKQLHPLGGALCTAQGSQKGQSCALKGTVCRPPQHTPASRPEATHPRHGRSFGLPGVSCEQCEPRAPRALGGLYPCLSNGFQPMANAKQTDPSWLSVSFRSQAPESRVPQKLRSCGTSAATGRTSKCGLWDSRWASRADPASKDEAVLANNQNHPGLEQENKQPRFGQI